MAHLIRRLFTVLFIMISGYAAGQVPVFNEDLKLTANDGRFQDGLGIAVGISGSTALVGSDLGGSSNLSDGSVYFFNLVNGQQIAELRPPNPVNDNGFGVSIAVDGVNAIIGAETDTASGGVRGGSAYVYNTVTRQLIRKLTAADASDFALFGHSVAIQGNLALVGSLQDRPGNFGSAYLFNWETGQQLYKFIASDAALQDVFGHSVAFHDSTALIGAMADDYNGQTNAGSVYVFDLDTGQELSKITPDDAGLSDLFGRRIVVSGDLAAIGADNAVYLFDVPSGNQIRKITPPPGASGLFGWSLSVNNNILIVGSASDSINNQNFAGSSYLYSVDTGELLARIVASDADRNDGFGWSVASSSSYIVAGADGEDADGVNGAGSAYAVRISSFDCNGNGVFDDMDIETNPSLDCDFDGRLDSCQIAEDPSIDCDGDGQIDSCQLLADPGQDCDGNGVIDTCQLAVDPSLDCDQNGVIDSCQIAANPSQDCDLNGIVDACQIAADSSLDCDQDGRIDFCQVVTDPSSDCDNDGFVDACQIAADPSLDCDQNGVIDSCQIASDSTQDCDLNGIVDTCQIAINPSLDCDKNGQIDYCQVVFNPEDDCNTNGVVDTCEIASDSSLDCNQDDLIDMCQINMDQSQDCNLNGILDICEITANPDLDCDSNGVIDTCQIATNQDVDCNQNGIVDSCEIALDQAIDCDIDGTLDECQIALDPTLDCDDDGVIDLCQIALDSSLDCNGDGKIDSCQISADPELDCDDNGVIDSCQIAADATLDCDSDGNLDFCQIDADPALDCDLNGRIDSCEIADTPSLDCNVNGELDICEIVQNPSFDCDGNLFLDACEIIADPSLDCDGDGVLDSCQIAADPSLDCDQNGQIDVCELVADPSLDCTQNGVLDVCDIRDNPDVYDCNDNGIPDGICEDLGLSAFEDCNADGVPDVCQIEERPELDCDGNGVLDECDLFAPVLEVVFVIDTSNSDADEVQLIGDTITGVSQDLLDAGITTSTQAFGILDTINPSFDSVIDPGNYVATLYGQVVSGMPPCCNLITSEESYAPAAAQVAANYPWQTLRNRVVVTFADESPFGGSPCNDPGDDRDVVTGTIGVANASGAVLVPVLTTGYSSCDEQLAEDLASGTGGQAFRSDVSGDPLRQRLADFLIDLATGDDFDFNEELDECQIANDPSLDCDENGLLDRIQINLDAFLDCDGNDILDSCDLPLATAETGEVGPVGGIGIPLVLPSADPAQTDVLIDLRARADLSAITEFIEIRIDGVLLERAFVIGALDCPFTADQTTVIIPADDFNAFVDGDDVIVELIPSAAVDAMQCTDSILEASLSYRPRTDEDCNGNGVPDLCDAILGKDDNGNGVPDECENPCPADVAEPFDILDLADISAFVTAFTAQDPIADLTSDGLIDLADITVFVTSFTAGCP